jgi:hypothetical protein
MFQSNKADCLSISKSVQNTSYLLPTEALPLSTIDEHQSSIPIRPCASVDDDFELEDFELDEDFEIGDSKLSFFNFSPAAEQFEVSSHNAVVFHHNANLPYVSREGVEKEKQGHTMPYSINRINISITINQYKPMVI